MGALGEMLETLANAIIYSLKGVVHLGGVGCCRAARCKKYQFLRGWGVVA